ncbi:MAG: DEAD/DEAH box helicase [Saprospiraceae bacterium]|nr:DEAD/DEAH box helicase [Saprospiraceae bacterium]
MRFTDLNLNEELLEALSYMGFEEATPIQEQAIPLILNNRDLIACAQTGTGKTAAFILPVLNQIAINRQSGTSALVIVPTRELALQIDQQIQGFAYFVGINSLSIYGGGDGIEFDQQKKALSAGADIVVATPGKLISHLNMGYVKFDHVKHLILDEADRMLDMGFMEDIHKIFSYLPNDRQNLMFSATMPPKIRKFAREFLRDPEEISIALSKPAEGVLQAAYLAYDQQKAELLSILIADKPNYKSILIFSSTKRKVFEIARSLKNKGFSVDGISSDLDQKEREEVLSKFRAKKTRILVATDVLSRGIDIKDINLVINYDVPGNAEDYVHRIGRTARADTTGVALTLINEHDMADFSQIEKLIEREVMKVPLPPELGQGPEWNPNFRGGGYGRGRGGNNSGGNRGGNRNAGKGRGPKGGFKKSKR